MIHLDSTLLKGRGVDIPKWTFIEDSKTSNAGGEVEAISQSRINMRIWNIVDGGRGLKYEV